MRRPVRVAAWVAACAATAAPLAVHAQGTVEVVRPAPADSLVSATPRFVVVARNIGVPASSLRIELTVATAPTFEAGTRVLDDTLPGDSVTFAPDRPLPSGVDVYWRAVARAGDQVVATSPITGPRRTARWLVLVAPDAPNGVFLDTRRPTFTWSSAPIDAPPGPWRYDLEIRGVGTGERLTFTGIMDTTFVPNRDLEVNTSYRWAVLARTNTRVDSVRVPSSGSFVITSPDRPLATLLYQNFPNPFPSASARVTCIWFDIARGAGVRLEILSLRGERVRTLYPRGGDALVLGPGRYGRADVGGNAGCDPRFTWDGTSDAGIGVPSGVYLLRLQVGDRWETRKMVYRGG